MKKISIEKISEFIEFLETNFTAVDGLVLSQEILDAIKVIIENYPAPIFVKEKESEKIFIVFKLEKSILLLPVTTEDVEYNEEKVVGLYANIDDKTKILFGNEYGTGDFALFLQLVDSFLPIDPLEDNRRYFKGVSSMAINFDDFTSLYSNGGLQIFRSQNQDVPLIKIVLEIDENNKYIIDAKEEKNALAVNLGKVNNKIISLFIEKVRLEQNDSSIKEELLQKLLEVENGIYEQNKSQKETSIILEEKDQDTLLKPKKLFTSLEI